MVRPKGIGTWTYLVLPFGAEKVFGTKSRIQVKGTIDGVPFRNTLLPSGDGNHFMVVDREIRGTIGKSAGDAVSVTMELDASPRLVIIPDDFQRALRKKGKARTVFSKLSYSHQKEYVRWIERAKKNETRESRIEKAVEMISRLKTLK